MKTSLLLLPAFLAAIAAHAADSPRLAVGQTAPDVGLRNDKGEPVRLRTLVKWQPTVLVFYRGGWCPFCTRHLVGLAEIEKDLQTAGVQLIAISPDKPEMLREKPTHAKLAYTLMSDSSAEAAKSFGIAFKVADDVVAKYKSGYKIDLEAASGETHHMLPHPAVYVVDPGGAIRFAHVNEDYKVRLEPKEILKAARESVSAAK